MASRLLNYTHKIVKRFGNSLPGDLGSKYFKAQDNVLTTIMYPNRELLSRRLILFAINEDNAHWSAMFVFNASFTINESVHGDHDLNKITLCPCFLRYCGLQPTGQRDTPMQYGSVWFLTLCFSVEVHEKEHGLLTNETLAFMEPFGSSVGTSFKTDLLLGTPQFPALHLPVGSNVLPIQHDISIVELLFLVPLLSFFVMSSSKTQKWIIPKPSTPNFFLQGNCLSKSVKTQENRIVICH